MTGGKKETTNSTIVGLNADVVPGVDNCFVFGDDCTGKEDGEYVIGSHIFGSPIPRRIADWIEEDTDAFVWILRTIGTAIGASRQGERDDS